MANGKCSELTHTAITIVFAIIWLIFLQALIVFSSLFTSFGIITLYALIIILSVLAGLLTSYVIHKLTQDDKQVYLTSIISITPAVLVAGMVLKAGSIIMDRIAEFRSQMGSAGMVSMFNEAVPNYIAAAALMFIFFHAIFFVEFFKKKNYNALLHIFISLLAVITLTILLSEFLISDLAMKMG
ncbi:hypothetical protein ACFL96_08445 [Thermoproteota archaeon]